MMAASALLCSFAFLFGHGYYLGKWMAIGAAITFMVAGELRKNYGLAAASLFTYLMGSTIYTAIYPNRFSVIDAYNNMGLKYYSVDSAWKLCLFVMPLLFLKAERWRVDEYGRLFCLCFFAISGSQVFWEWVTKGCHEVNSCGGALMNPSLNGAALATVLPLIPVWPLATVVALLCAFLGKTSIGCGVTSVFLVIKAVEKKLWWVLSLIPVVLTLGVITHGNKEFFDSSARFQMWSFFIEKWAINWKNIPFGTGFGTFGVFSLALQKGFNVNASDWWIWAHNDWLQMLFECGAVGAVLLLWVFADCAWGLWNKRLFPELQSLLLFGIVMGCEYSLHIGPVCAFSAWLIYLGMGKQNTEAMAVER